MHRLYVDGRDVAELETASSARARSRGLLGRVGIDGALWLSPARQVHTFRMRFAIDVAHVGRDGTVLHTRVMPPGRLGRWVWNSRRVLEAFAERGLKQGARVRLTSPDDVDAGRP